MIFSFLPMCVFFYSFHHIVTRLIVVKCVFALCVCVCRFQPWNGVEEGLSRYLLVFLEHFLSAYWSACWVTCKRLLLPIFFAVLISLSPLWRVVFDTDIFVDSTSVKCLIEFLVSNYKIMMRKIKYWKEKEKGRRHGNFLLKLLTIRLGILWNFNQKGFNDIS